MTEGSIEPDATGVEGQQQVEETAPVAEPTEDEKFNQAWAPVLEVLPKGLHGQVTPHLKTWDQNFNKKLTEVHQQYEPFKQYLDSQIQPETINYGLNLLQQIEDDPQAVITAIQAYAQENGITLQQAAKEVAEEQTGDEGTDEDDPILNHPLVKQLQEQQNLMAQLLMGQYEEQQQTQEDEALDQELAQLHEEFKDQPFDEEWVLMKFAYDYENGNGGKALKEYVNDYHNFVNGIRADSRRPGPTVIKGAGIAPSNQADPSKMNEAERKAYITNLLRAGAEQNG